MEDPLPTHSSGPPTLEGIRKRLLDAARARASERDGRSILTGQEIADLSGVSQSVWSNWTKAQDSKEPRILGLAAVARALGVSLDWLVYGDDYAGLLNESFVADMRAIARLDPKTKKKERRRLLARLLRRHIYPYVTAILFGAIQRRVRPVTREEVEKLEVEMRGIFDACAPKEAAMWDRLIAPWTKRVDTLRSGV